MEKENEVMPKRNDMEVSLEGSTTILHMGMTHRLRADRIWPARLHRFVASTSVSIIRKNCALFPVRTLSTLLVEGPVFVKIDHES